MKKIIITVLSMFIFCLPGYAITTTGEETKDPESDLVLLNGHAWKNFSKAEKEIYLKGIKDMTSSASALKIVFGGPEVDQETISFIEGLSNLIPADVPLADVTKSLEDFYKEDKYRIVPIVSAYFSVMADINQWGDEDQRKEMVEKIRKFYNGEWRPEIKKETALPEVESGSAEGDKNEVKKE